jgi:hypothetical protein
MEIIESQNGQPAQIGPQPIVKEEEDEQVVDEKTNLVQMSEMTTSNFLLKSQGDLLTDASRDQDEKQRVGLLSSNTYFNYFRIGGGYFGACLCIALFIVSQLSIVVSDYWVSNWANEEAKNKILNSSIFAYDPLNNLTNVTVEPFYPAIFERRYYYFYIYCGRFLDFLLMEFKWTYF